MDEDKEGTQNAAASPEPEMKRGRKDIAPKMNSEADEKTKMKAAFDAQKKFTVVLRQNPPNFDQLPRWVGSINGYPWQIERNEPVEVPESLYLLLVSCSETTPQRKQDKELIEKPAAYPLTTHGYISEQVKKGLIGQSLA